MSADLTNCPELPKLISSLESIDYYPLDNQLPGLLMLCWSYTEVAQDSLVGLYLILIEKIFLSLQCYYINQYSQ